jgi:GT2 family glycosyltransferase
MMRKKLAQLIAVSLEQLYRFFPAKLTSWLLFQLSYFALKKSPLFDPKYYRASNPDLEHPRQDPVIHYLKKGARQGLNPNPWFDTSFYMSIHPGIVSASINPLSHYLMFGARQGYNPHPLFDTSYYFSENPEVPLSGMNPLSHFIRFGLKEGKIPHPLLKGVSPENFLAVPYNELLTKRMLQLYAVTPNKIRWMKRNVESFSFKPQITIVLFGSHDGEKLTKSVESIVDQAYRYWDLIIATGPDPRLEIDIKTLSLEKLCDDAKVTFISEQYLLESSDWESGQFMAFLRNGDTLTSDSLFELVKGLNLNPECDLIYPDEYRTSKDGQGEFFFKPEWSPDLLSGTNYIGDFFLLNKNIFDSIGGLSKPLIQDGAYDLLLKVSAIKSNVIRLAMPLVHRQALTNDNSKSEQEAPLGISGTSRIKRKIKRSPLVSIIIPTAYSNPDENLFPCLRTIVERTSYSNYEIIIMDNSHGELLADRIHGIVPKVIRLRVVEYNERFNYAAVMNIGASESYGAYLLMLNDDIAIVSPDWVQSMLEYAQMDEIGVVGAKLLYPDGKIQHAGCSITDNHGFSRHAFQYMSDAPDLYFGIAALARNCSFVTFACVLIRKDLFFQLGGLDERFSVEQNDSDFCLRVITAGYRIVYTPFALIIHKDARSRSMARMIKVAPNIQHFHDKWRDFIEKGDPYYNPNLSLDTPNYWLNDRPVLIEPLGHPLETLVCSTDSGEGKVLNRPSSLNHASSPKLNKQLLIGIDSTSSDAMRTWPPEHFTRLSDLLSTNLQASVTMNTGSEDFRATKDAIDLLIGGLNENSNLAASMGIPTLVIWPGCASPQDSGFVGENVLMVRMAVPCSPCYKTDTKKCPYDMKCLKMLWPYKVFEAAREALVFFGA